MDRDDTKRVSILTVNSLHHNGWLDTSDPAHFLQMGPHKHPKWAHKPEQGKTQYIFTSTFSIFLNKKLKPGLQNGFLHTS